MEIYAYVTVPTLLLLIVFMRVVKTTNGVSLILLAWTLAPLAQLFIVAMMLLYFLALKAGGHLDRLYLWWKSSPYR